MGRPSKCDFSGWATKNDILCTDGVVIRHGAFSANNGKKVPLMFQHFHDDPKNCLGHAYLEERNEGMYAYCCFNDSETAQDAKELVKHGDFDTLSIFAGQIRRDGKNIVHGDIKEVSLVMAGANAGAKIENTYFAHADGSTTIDESEVIIKMGGRIMLYADDEIQHADNEDATEDSEETIEDVINTFNEKQKKVFLYCIVQAAQGGQTDDTVKQSDATEEGDYISHSEEGNDIMKYNVFDGAAMGGDYIEHGDELRNDILTGISKDNRSRNNITSLKDYIEHAAQDYGIKDIEWLFPDARQLNNTPEFIKREDDWVDEFMNGTKHLPFSRVKMRFADITADEARAKGYTKGNRKTEEVFTLLRRSVEPTTIYKKQKLDRDDILDITDFDVVVWLKTEMRMMLNEEIARAALIGDGRSTASQDKIKEANIIPIYKDADLFSIPVRVEFKANDSDDAKSEKVIRTVLKARKNYKGSGNPTFYTTEDVLTDMLLIEDGIGRRKYNTPADVAQALRVKKIVTVPVMEGVNRTVDMGEGKNETRNLIGIIVNPIDYSFGSDKGGNVAMFEDFDIDFNQEKYLMETRCSGALTKPFSAMIVESVEVSG